MRARLSITLAISAIFLVGIGGCRNRPAADDEETVPTKPPVNDRDSTEIQAISQKLNQYHILTTRDKQFLERHMCDKNGAAYKVLAGAGALGLYKDSDRLLGAQSNLISLHGSEAVEYLDGYLTTERILGRILQPTPEPIKNQILDGNLNTLSQNEKKTIVSWLSNRGGAKKEPDFTVASYSASLLVSKKSFSKDDKIWVSKLMNSHKDADLKLLNQQVGENRKTQTARLEKKLAEQGTVSDKARADELKKIEQDDKDYANALTAKGKQWANFWDLINRIVQGKPGR